MPNVPLSVRAQAEQERRRRAARAQSTARLSHEDFAAQRLRILDKDKQLVPLRYNTVQRELIGNLSGRDLILKARQHGVSTVIQGLLYEAAVTSTATTLTLAKDDSTTQILRRLNERYHRNDPNKPQRGNASAELSTYPLTDSEAMVATAGNSTSGRAATLTHLHGSEVAYWKDAEAIITGAGQAGKPAIYLESTPNGQQGHFYNLCMEALDGVGTWRLHFYPWWLDAAYALPIVEPLTLTDDELLLIEAHDLTPEQIAWRRSKQRELKHQFIQEYPEDPRSCFLASGYGYFGDVAYAFQVGLAMSYEPGHVYVAGLDFGQTKDFTVLAIKDVTTNRQVAMLRINGYPWAEMRRQIVAMCKTWHVSKLIGESNSMGSTNIEALQSELNAAGCGTYLEAFDTTNESKAAIMGSLHEALHHGNLLLLDDPVLRQEINAFVATQLPSGAWRLAAGGQGHDDTVIATALMQHAGYQGWSVSDIRLYAQDKMHDDPQVQVSTGWASEYSRLSKLEDEYEDDSAPIVRDRR